MTNQTPGRPGAPMASIPAAAVNRNSAPYSRVSGSARYNQAAETRRRHKKTLRTVLLTIVAVVVIAAGVAAATVCRDRLEPCHAAFAAQRPENCHRVLSLTREDPRANAFLRGETVVAPDLTGWTAVAIDGVVVGFGKTSGGMLKNRYPKGLRLRRQ